MTNPRLGAHCRPQTPARGTNYKVDDKSGLDNTTINQHEKRISGWCILTRKIVVHFNPQNDKRIEALDGVIGVIIGQSYGGKSLGRQAHTGAVKIQRSEAGGLKAVTQSAKGLQELFIRVHEGQEEAAKAEIQKIV